MNMQQIIIPTDEGQRRTAAELVYLPSHAHTCSAPPFSLWNFSLGVCHFGSLFTPVTGCDDGQLWAMHCIKMDTSFDSDTYDKRGQHLWLIPPGNSRERLFTQLWGWQLTSAALVGQHCPKFTSFWSIGGSWWVWWVLVWYVIVLVDLYSLYPLLLVESILFSSWFLMPLFHYLTCLVTHLIYFVPLALYFRPAFWSFSSYSFTAKQKKSTR